jgi:hypothetical protein
VGKKGMGIKMKGSRNGNGGWWEETRDAEGRRNAMLYCGKNDEMSSGEKKDECRVVEKETEIQSDWKKE